ncbi:unnamed protein product [Cochlearia groenlandica]
MKDDELAGDNNNTVSSFDWRISASNPQLMGSFRQDLCNNDNNGGFNLHTDDDADTSNVMGWSMNQFPDDSGFIDRAARSSLYGSFMVNNVFASGGSNMCNGVFEDGSKLVNDISNRPSKLSDDSQSSDHAKCGFDSNKRKRNVKVKILGQGSCEEQEDKKKSPNSNAINDTSKDGYVHMRARRGQATNSHSIAERVRREKISERMKFLQDLVPGCDKVTGKAVMLDEIINYVQSLQCQIEFLSMKLSTVNPLLDSNLESLLAKDEHQSSTPTFPHNMSMLYPPLQYLPQRGIMRPNPSSVSSLNGVSKRQNTHGDHHNVVHVNHETGTAPDHQEATANTKAEP